MTNVGYNNNAAEICFAFSFFLKIPVAEQTNLTELEMNMVIKKKLF